MSLADQQQAPAVVWEKDDDPKGDVIKLEVGQQVIGTIEGVVPKKHEDGKTSYEYKIHVVGEDEARSMYGTTVLDQYMEPHNIGDLVRIRRLENKPSKYGNPLQMYEVDHPKAAAPVA